MSPNSKQITDGGLAAVLAWGGEPLVEVLDLVERSLSEATNGYGAQLTESANVTLGAGGKRLRPLLVFVAGASALDEADSRNRLIDAATAVELVHMATLIHDDLVDAAQLRRGQPTVAATWGPQRARATGDFLLARAFAVMAKEQPGAPIRALSVACLKLARGELAQRQSIGDPDVTVDSYLERCRLKTASLFEAACTIGAFAASSSVATVERLAEYGAAIGLAFQILDDVLDIGGDPAKTGKPFGTDLREGTATLPVLLAEDRNPGLLRRALAAESDEEIAEACRLVIESGALSAATGRAIELVDEAKRTVGEADLPESQRDVLLRVAEGVVQRYA